MNLKKMSAITVGLLLLAPHIVLAQDNYEGLWMGTVGTWTIRLTVMDANGPVGRANGHLRMRCNVNGDTYEFDIPVSAGGAISAYVSPPDMARRQVTGQLPTLTVPPIGCPGATGTLRKW